MKTWFSMKAGDASDEISIFDEIGMWGVTAKDFIDQLRALKAPAVTLSINSPGGSVFDGIAIYNALRNSGKHVTVRVMGVAASAASYIAMAGDKIVMPENSFMMVHNPMGGAYGNAEEMRDMADVLDKIAASLISTYAKRTGKSEEEVKALLDNETYMTAAEAVELGFADEMEPVLAIAASFDLDRLPENVRAAYEMKTEPAPVVETPTAFSATVAAAVEAAGLKDHAAFFALTCTDKPSLEAALATATEIVALCSVANQAAKADKFIRARASLDDVRADLLNTLAQQDEDTQTDGHQPAESTPKIEKPTAGVKSADIWASRRQS